MKTSRVIGGIFLTIGLLVVSAGGYCFWSTQNLLSNGLRSTGKVIELRKESTDRYYTPVIQFESADHTVMTASSKIGSNPPEHTVGDTVTVIYRAESPKDITLDDPFELWFLTGLFGGLGMIFVIIGGGMVVYSIRKA